jgi:hypothetical protein
VANVGIGDQVAGTRVADHLTDFDGDASVRFLGEALGLDLARDRCELPVPVFADRSAAASPTAFPGVRAILRDTRCEEERERSRG